MRPGSQRHERRDRRAEPHSDSDRIAGSGTAIADGWSTYSSRRWKTNIHTLHDALGKIEQLRGVSYDLKDPGKHEIGVIAQEVGAVVPEVVSCRRTARTRRASTMRV
jgi:hypothetical protein